MTRFNIFVSFSYNFWRWIRSYSCRNIIHFGGFTTVHKSSMIVIRAVPCMNHNNFCKQSGIYCTAAIKRLVHCLHHSLHGDIVWPHVGAGVIVSLRIFNTRFQQGSTKYNTEVHSRKILLTSEKSLLTATETKIAITMEGRAVDIFSAVELLVDKWLWKMHSSWVRIRDYCLCFTEQRSTMSHIWIFITHFWC